MPCLNKKSVPKFPSKKLARKQKSDTFDKNEMGDASICGEIPTGGGLKVRCAQSFEPKCEGQAFIWQGRECHASKWILTKHAMETSVHGYWEWVGGYVNKLQCIR